MQRFSDFAVEEEKCLSGEKVSINSLFDKEIIISDFKIRDSRYKDRYDKYAAVQFYEESNVTKRIFFTGSSVIINMLTRYSDKIPFITTIRKIDKYYTLT